MSTTATFDTYSDSTVSDEPAQLEYRALYTGSIIGLALGLFSVCLLLTAGTSFDYCLMLTPIPILGAFVSLRSIAKIRRESDQYTGLPVAIAGLVLSLFFLISGVSYGGYVYATEVPEGYERTSFAELKPSDLHVRAGKAIPPEIEALDGKPVFIKGYIRPDSISISKGIDEFLLVRDNNQCCFGDLSKINFYDQMIVNMVGSKRVDYVSGIYRMGGILRIHPENIGRGPDAPVYTLEADYAKW